jgi:hypothetical protein
LYVPEKVCSSLYLLTDPLAKRGGYVPRKHRDFQNATGKSKALWEIGDQGNSGHCQHE